MHLNAAPFRFSKIQLFIVLGLHLLTVVFLWFAAISLSAKLIVCLLMILLLPKSLQQPKDKFFAVGKDQDDYWYLVQDGEQNIVKLLEGTIRTPYFVQLKILTKKNKKIHMPIFPDSLHPDDFRRLKAVLYCTTVPSPTIADRL